MRGWAKEILELWLNALGIRAKNRKRHDVQIKISEINLKRPRSELIKKIKDLEEDLKDEG